MKNKCPYTIQSIIGEHGCTPSTVAFEVLHNGNIKLTLQDLDELLLINERNTSELGVLYDLMDNANLIGNNWFQIKNPDEIPVIGFYDISDNEDEVDCVYNWVYRNYLTRRLEIDGFVIFELIWKV